MRVSASPNDIFLPPRGFIRNVLLCGPGASWFNPTSGQEAHRLLMAALRPIAAEPNCSTAIIVLPLGYKSGARIVEILTPIYWPACVTEVSVPEMS